jgi:hypothetical protein
MNKFLLITTKSLKDFLSIFESNELLADLSLGDTWHPSSGFVDEKILGELPTVGNVLEFDYDFKGLVGFSASISTVKVKLLSDLTTDEEQSFEVSAGDGLLRKLSNKIIEINAYKPNSYKLEFISNWEASSES